MYASAAAYGCAFQCASACVTVTPKSTPQKSIALALKFPHATDIKLNIGMGLMHLRTVPGTRESKRVSESRDYKLHTECSGSSIQLFFLSFVFFPALISLHYPLQLCKTQFCFAKKFSVSLQRLQRSAPRCIVFIKGGFQNANNNARLTTAPKCFWWREQRNANKETTSLSDV